MKYKEIEELIESKVAAINTSIVFHAGLFSELNIAEKKKDTIAWLVPMSSTGSFTNKVSQNNRTFTALVYIFKKSNAGDIRSQYMPHVHAADQIAEDIVNGVRDSEPAEGTIDVDSYAIETSIKYGAACLTGAILRMTITTSDNYKCNC